MIAEIRAGIADRLSSIVGLNVDPYMVERIRPPHAMIDFEIDYDLVLGRSKDTYPFSVIVFVQRDNSLAGQRLLDGLRDPNNPSSVKQVLENGDLFAVDVDYVQVKKASRVQVVSHGNPAVEYLMVEFEVEVVA